MDFNIPKYVENIINKLEEENYEAYMVGGSVRDLLIGKEASDYDITTNALPKEIERVFKEYRTLEVGKQFGTIVVIQEEGTIEVTTFRSDGEYKDGRRPETVYFSRNLKDDLSRRDFTINAMAYNKKTGLIDPFDGRGYLNNKLIKTVGNPDKRFKEDYLRIIRTIRFATVLEFFIEDDTYKSCKIHGEKLLEISIERVRDEFNKILDWMAELDEVNTDDVEPLISVNEQTLRLRDDEVSDGNQRDAVLKNAPSAEFDYFLVPKVVE